MSAAPMGRPGWPLLACSTASMASARMALAMRSCWARDTIRRSSALVRDNGATAAAAKAFAFISTSPVRRRGYHVRPWSQLKRVLRPPLSMWLATRPECRREHAQRAAEPRIRYARMQHHVGSGQGGKRNARANLHGAGRCHAPRQRGDAEPGNDGSRDGRDAAADKGLDPWNLRLVQRARSEERRVGKECRSRWTRQHEKKTKK